MKRGATDLSGVVTALSSFQLLSPLCPPKSSFRSLRCSARCPLTPYLSLHLPPLLFLRRGLIFGLVGRKLHAHARTRCCLCMCSYCMCLFSPPSTANSPPPPHSQLLKQRGKQWSRAEQWLPQWCTGVVYLFEAWACPTCFPSNPPTVTDGASVPRLGLHYSVTSLCQRHSLTTRRDMKNGREARNIFMHACTCTCVPRSED